VNQSVADAENRALFFEHWFKGLPEETACRLTAGAATGDTFLDSWRRFKPFTLSEAEERIITLKDVNGTDALVTLYDMLTSAFTFHLKLQGKRKTLTQDQIASYVRDPSPEMRARPIERYIASTPIRVQYWRRSTDHRVRDWHSEMTSLRHFVEPISARNTMNDLLPTLSQHTAPCMPQQYARFPALLPAQGKWFKMDRLRRYDIYAPLASSEKRYELPQAIDMVLDSFGGFFAGACGTRAPGAR